MLSFSELKYASNDRNRKQSVRAKVGFFTFADTNVEFCKAPDKINNSASPMQKIRYHNNQA